MRRPGRQGWGGWRQAKGSETLRRGHDGDSLQERQPHHRRAHPRHDDVRLAVAQPKRHRQVHQRHRCARKPESVEQPARHRLHPRQHGERQRHHRSHNGQFLTEKGACVCTPDALLLAREPARDRESAADGPHERQQRVHCRGRNQRIERRHEKRERRRAEYSGSDCSALSAEAHEADESTKGRGGDAHDHLDVEDPSRHSKLQRERQGKHERAAQNQKNLEWHTMCVIKQDEHHHHDSRRRERQGVSGRHARWCRVGRGQRDARWCPIGRSQRRGWVS